MAKRLEDKINKEGGTAEEWAMLGRTHKHLGDNAQAARAFAVALEQDTDNAQLMLEQAEVLALNNNRQFADDSRALVRRAYELEPDNANVLWFVGVAEYQAGNYHQAIDHLTRLLPMAGGEEEVMKSIVSIVAQSRQQLIAAGEKMPELDDMLGIKAIRDKAAGNTMTAATGSAGASQASSASALQIKINVDVNEQVRSRFDANDTVFVYAKAKQGPRMPLAAQRLTLSALPATVILDDSMAMVEGMNISAFEQLVVSARVTKTGSAMAQSGDYIAQVDVDDKNVKTTLNLVIDTVIP